MTRPSVVRDLVSTDPVRRARSVEVIARGYWQPIYRYIRIRWSAQPSEAEDLTQSFFDSALDREALSTYEPGRARFRTFLRTCLDRHVIDQHRRSTAERRGGGRHQLEVTSLEAELPATPLTDDPEAVFDAEWLRHLLGLAVEQLEATFKERGKPIHAALFRTFHLGDDPPSYSDVAATHGISVTDVTNWLHVARREFRRIALDLLRELTASEEEFDQEALAVFGIDTKAAD